MFDILQVLLILLLLVAFNGKACMFLAHILNNILNLPHPGPEDIQGTCWCRRHEDKNKYSLMEYVLCLIERNIN